MNDVNPGSWLNRNRDRDGRADAMVQCTEILLSAGAQPGGQDKFGYTAAHLAAWAGTNRAEPLALHTTDAYIVLVPSEEQQAADAVTTPNERRTPPPGLSKTSSSWSGC